MKLNRKWILVMSLVLSVAIATGSTLAYMTATTEKVTNTFTLGNVTITLTEPAWGNNNDPHPLYPGTPVAKDPTITNTGRTNAWVWMEMTMPAEVYPYLEFQTIDTSKWIIDATDVATTGEVTLLYRSTLAPNGKATPFTAVELAEDANLTLESFNIEIIAYAIQDKPFEDVEGAYAAFMSEQPAESVDALMAALANGQNAVANNTLYNVVTSEEPIDLDAKGATVTLQGTPTQENYHGYIGWVSDNVEVSNLKVAGSGFVQLGIYGGPAGNNVANNLKIRHLASTLANDDKGFTLACAFAQYGTGTLNNCVMKGTTALVEGAIPVDLGCVNGTTTTINGGEYGTVYCWSQSNVTVDDAEVDTLWVSPINGTVTVKDGTHVKTLKVDYGTSAATKARLQKIVIEEGATVDTITFKDANAATTTTYTLEQWADFVANFT